MESRVEDIEDLKAAVFGCESQQTPGLNRKVARIEQVLSGDDDSLGLTQKVNIVWRVHVWLLCLFSGIAGSFLTLAVQRLTN